MRRSDELLEIWADLVEGDSKDVALADRVWEMYVEALRDERV